MPVLRPDVVAVGLLRAFLCPSADSEAMASLRMAMGFGHRNGCV